MIKTRSPWSPESLVHHVVTRCDDQNKTLGVAGLLESCLLRTLFRVAEMKRLTAGQAGNVDLGPP